MDWTRFSFEYRLRLDVLTSDLIRIEASREAAHNLVLPPDWKTQLDQLNRVGAVHGTSAGADEPDVDYLWSGQVLSPSSCAAAVSSSSKHPNRTLSSSLSVVSSQTRAAASCTAS